MAVRQNVPRYVRPNGQPFSYGEQEVTPQAYRGSSTEQLDATASCLTDTHVFRKGDEGEDESWTRTFDYRFDVCSHSDTHTTTCLPPQSPPISTYPVTLAIVGKHKNDPELSRLEELQLQRSLKEVFLGTLHSLLPPASHSDA
jgi:hypothetical protein